MTTAQKLDFKLQEARESVKAWLTEKGGFEAMTKEDLTEFHNRDEEINLLAEKLEAATKAERIDADLKGQTNPADAQPHPGQKNDDGQAQTKSLGQLFIESKAYESARHGELNRVMQFPDVEVKTLMTRTANGWAPFVTRRDAVEFSPQQGPSAIDVIPKTQTGESAIKYMLETVFTNNAAEAAEGAIYGEAALTYVEQTVPVEKVGVWLPVTDEEIEDVSRFRDTIDGRLMAMLQQRLEKEIIQGNGSTPNLRGVLAATNLQNQNKGVLSVPDAVLTAMTLVRSVGFSQPTAAIFHPTDWCAVRLLQTTDGVYIFGSPSEAGPERIWGVPVVQSTYCAASGSTAGVKMVVGDFARKAELTMRRGVDIQITNSHDTNFIYGKQAIRADIRCAALWLRGTAFCTVTLNA
jgi:HK97 family phage major capsid protein